MHWNEEKMWNLSELILFNILIYTNGYLIKCPQSSQWNFKYKSFGCSGQQTYICLLDGIKSYKTTTVYTEKCGPADISKEGSKYILTPDLYQVPCAASQYQPFTFTTNGNSQCVFSKSLCKSSGQVLANNGCTITDRSCRCDYRENYDYVIPPKDPCSCKPAEEDCSCYIRNCEDDKVMIADYRCMKRVDTILPEDIRCPIISRIIPPEENDAVYKKQLQPVSGSRTWSMQASVILIVVVIIFIVIIGFLFFSVPHVTSMLLESQIKLSVKSKENEYLILNGDSVKIECNVKSYLPVRSVTWQTEKDGEIIQITPYNGKYEMDFGKRPSLKINNFNAGDQRKYRCIVKNAVGLRNDGFGSCMNHMSIVNWLTRIVKVLQHIPAFHLEDMMYMTLHTYDIKFQLKPTVYNVYKGDDITMETHFDDQHKLIAVKWFKESDIRTELDMSSEQYSGGVPDVPSLTIKNTTIENAGKYFCLLIYDNGETQNSLFKLKIIPQVKIYKALLDLRVDKTFIRPSVCDTIDQNMKENDIVVVTGREGSGKSIISLELASIYDEKDYMIIKVDLSENHTTYTDMVDTLLIIDDQQYTQHSLNAFMEHILPVLTKRNIKVILTCRNLDLEIVRRIPEINKLKEEVFINIDSCLTAEEKEGMLRSYMKLNQVTSSSSAESNFRSLEIMTDLSVQVTLDENAIKVIRNEEPWKGFPLSALLFCSERKFLHLGERYFTNPPSYLVEELKEMYRKASYCIDKINDYCVLVYIIKNKNHQLDLNGHNICSQFEELYRTLFHYKYIPEKPGSKEDKKNSIVEAVHRMNKKYLKYHEGVYTFSHPCLLKAMFLSSDYMVNCLLQNGSLHDITEFVRCEGYTALEKELVVKLDENFHQILCERLVSHAFENRDLQQHVAQYIYSYWRSSDTNLVNKMFKYIESILFKSFGVDTVDPLSFDNECLSEKSINLEGPVQFFKVILLIDELTYKGRDPWIFGPGSADILILSALVSAAMNRYATDRVHTFKILVDEFENRVHFESFVKLWSKPLDIYGNTFFHYLMGLNQKEASAILSMRAEMKYSFDTENAKKYTPLDIAAFLGKIDIFKVLNLKTSNCTRKLRNRLNRLAKRGKDEYFNKYFKNKNIDQIKEEDDENNQYIYFFKLNLRHRKEESNEKENHDKKDILCFEDFMINVVENEKIEDYQSIIKLFQKFD